MLSQFPLTFRQTQNGMPHFITELMTIFVLMEMVFRDHLGDFPWEDILSAVLLLLLENFVSGLRLELMYISLI